MNTLAKFVFESLKGQWNVKRVIDGQASSLGQARFELITENELHYHENGTLILSDGKQFPASQSYIYRLDENTLHVYFAEAPVRVFHKIDLGTNPSGILEGSGLHICGEDCYQIRYLFFGSESFEIQYEIQGPSKDYTIVCSYSRDSKKSLAP